MITARAYTFLVLLMLSGSRHTTHREHWIPWPTVAFQTVSTRVALGSRPMVECEIIRRSK